MNSDQLWSAAKAFSKQKSEELNKKFPEFTFSQGKMGSRFSDHLDQYNPFWVGFFVTRKVDNLISQPEPELANTSTVGNEQAVPINSVEDLLAFAEKAEAYRQERERNAFFVIIDSETQVMYKIPKKEPLGMLIEKALHPTKEII